MSLVTEVVFVIKIGIHLFCSMIQLINSLRCGWSVGMFLSQLHFVSIEVGNLQWTMPHFRKLPRCLFLNNDYGLVLCV